MLTHPTIDQLRTLMLDSMADAFVELEAQDRTKELSHAEWPGLLIDRETAQRSTKRLQSRFKAARLRHGQASIEDVDFRSPRKLDKALFQQLATCRRIAEHRNVLVTGPCGICQRRSNCAAHRHRLFLSLPRCRNAHSAGGPVRIFTDWLDREANTKKWRD